MKRTTTKHSPLTPEQTEQAVKLFREGYTLQYIERAIDSTYQKTRNGLMLELGQEYAVIVERNRASLALSAEEVEEMAAMYRSLEYSQVDLAARFNVGVETVRTQLRRVMPDYSAITHQQMRKQSKRRLPIDWQQVYDTLYCEQQLNYSQIARRVGCCSYTARNRLMSLPNFEPRED